jgi:hypothetical protein
MTSRVALRGWDPSVNQQRISLVHAMRAHAGLSLPEGKQLLDRFVDEGEIVLSFASDEKARAFSAAATECGALAHILKE